tara:strand:+ start:1396 stop:1602 length:207 start_codon:yes stop_codon:yes gene_type:complete
MNVKEFKEIVEASNYISSVGEYVIRKFKTSDNYILIDKIGDFIVIENDKVDGICSAIWTDVQSKEMVN